MGLAILSILIFHFTEDCVNAGYNLIWPVVTFKKYIGSSGVDVFLFLSGLGLYYSFKKTPDQKNFYKKRLSRILIPYFIVALPSWIIYDVFIAHTGVLQVFKDVFFVSFFTENVIWFWYILLMAICYLVYPYLFAYIEQDDRDKVKMLQIFTLITLVAVLFALYNPSFYGRIEIALTRFPVFFAGALIGKASYQDKKISFGSLGVLLFSLLAILLRTTSKGLLSRYIVGIYAIAIFVLTAIVLEVFARRGLKCNFLKKILEWLGSYSLELYLTHVALRRIMLGIGLPTYRVRYYALLMAMSLALSLVVKKLTSWITKINNDN